MVNWTSRSYVNPDSLISCEILRVYGGKYATDPRLSVQDAAQPADRRPLLDRDLEVLAGPHRKQRELVARRPIVTQTLRQLPQAREVGPCVLGSSGEGRHRHQPRQH